MKNFNKISAAALALLMTGSLASCSGSEKAVLEEAAGFLWNMYNAQKTVKTADFDLMKEFSYDGKDIALTWDLQFTSGSTDKIKVNEKDAKSYTVSVTNPYYNELLTAEAKYTAVPTLSLNGKSYELSKLLGKEKVGFDWSTPKFVKSTRADWDENKKGATYNIKAVVTGVKTKDNSYYLQDEEGYGYYGYQATSTGAQIGDTVIFTGSRSDYSGQQEFAKGGTYVVLETKSVNKVVADGTAEWKAATVNTAGKEGSISEKWQNNLVSLRNCTPVSNDGSNWFFTVDGGTTQFNVYTAQSYFCDDAMNNAFKEVWNDAVANGKKLNIQGISTYYNRFQVYGSTAVGTIATAVEATPAEKAAAAATSIKTQLEASEWGDGEISLTVPSYVTKVEYTVTSGTTVAVDSVSGKLVATQTAAASENKVKVEVTVGEAVETVENVTVTSKAKSFTITKINELTTEKATIKGVIVALNSYGEAYVSDGTGIVYCGPSSKISPTIPGTTTAFKNNVKVGATVIITGTPSDYFGWTEFGYNDMKIEDYDESTVETYTSTITPTETTVADVVTNCPSVTVGDKTQPGTSFLNLKAFKVTGVKLTVNGSGYLNGVKDGTNTLSANAASAIVAKNSVDTDATYTVVFLAAGSNTSSIKICVISVVKEAA